MRPSITQLPIRIITLTQGNHSRTLLPPNFTLGEQECARVVTGNYRFTDRRTASTDYSETHGEKSRGQAVPNVRSTVMDTQRWFGIFTIRASSPPSPSKSIGCVSIDDRSSVAECVYFLHELWAIQHYSTLSTWA